MSDFDMGSVINEGQEVIQQEMPQQVVPQQQVSPQQMSAGGDPEFDALLKDVEGGKPVEAGTKISRVPVEKYRGSTQKIDRISFLTNMYLPLKVHYFDGIGSIVCFEGKCCEFDGMPRARALYPIVLYSTDSKGKIIASSVELRVLSAGDDLNETIGMAKDAMADKGLSLTDGDYLVRCSDDKYQKLAIGYAGDVQWTKSAELRNFVKEKFKKNRNSLYMAVANKVSEETLLQRLGMEGDGVTGGSPAYSGEPEDLHAFFGEEG